jgi:hypothetical protein
MALGMWMWRRPEKENHTGLEEHVVSQSLNCLAAWRSRMPKCECEESVLFECETIMSHFQQTLKYSRLHITRL